MTTRMALSIDPSKCTGCQICMLWCSFHKEGVVGPAHSRIFVAGSGSGSGVDGRIEVTTCAQCEAPTCVKACDYGALVFDDKDGIVRVSGELCTGCGFCREYCPIRAITVSRVPGGRKTAKKCDLCDGAPVCVSVCPTRALQVSEVKSSAQGAVPYTGR